MPIQPRVSHTFVVTSALGRLLAERHATQKELARLAGVSEHAVSCIKNRVILRIDCRAAARMCAALSEMSVKRTGRAIRIGLGDLFPLVEGKER